MPLNILLTALELDSYTGVPLYTRDVALELKRLGHFPEIYTLKMGAIARELMDANIPVTDNPSQISVQPDIIHGQHRVSTLIAVRQFRSTPAVFICHNHTFWGDQAPFHPHILRYFGVSLVCMERLKMEGVSEHQIHFLANFVDTNRFLPRDVLPEKPKKALIFSNYANERTQLPAIREACERAGLNLSVIGVQADYSARPENELGKYEIVFAKAKAAMEAMAVGTAVILCDFSGVGPLVTAREFDGLRHMNFGFQTLTQPLQPENILAQIARYNPAEAVLVRDLIRSTASLEKSVIHLVSIYHEVLEEYRHKKINRTIRGKSPSLHESIYWERARFWASLTPDQENFLKSIATKDLAALVKTQIFVNVEALYFARPPFRERFLMALIERVQKLKLGIIAVFKFLPIKLWMLFPVWIRMQIKKMPGMSRFSKRIKKILGVE
jgi:hypothetical protein